MLFISIRATPLQRYLSAYNKDVASNKVATLRSVQLRIANWAVQSRFREIYICMSVCRFVYDSMGNPCKKTVCQNAWEELRNPNMRMFKVSFGSLKQSTAWNP